MRARKSVVPREDLDPLDLSLTPKDFMHEIILEHIDPLTSEKTEEIKKDFPELFAFIFGLVQSKKFRERSSNQRRFSEGNDVSDSRKMKNTVKQRGVYYLYTAMTIESICALRGYRNRTTSMGRSVALLASLAKSNRSVVDLISQIQMSAGRTWAVRTEKKMFSKYMGSVIASLVAHANGNCLLKYVDNHNTKGRRQHAGSGESGFSITPTTCRGVGVLSLEGVKIDTSEVKLSVPFDAERSKALFESRFGELNLDRVGDVFGVTYTCLADEVRDCVANFPSLRHFWALTQLVGVNL